MASFSGWRLTRAGIIFFAGVIVLGLLAFGVAYFVQQRGEQVRRDEAAEIARQNLEAASENPATTDETTDGENAEEVPAPEVAAPAPEAPATPPQADRADADQDAEALPQTGPAETAMVIGVAAVTFATAAYVNSRKAARRT